MRAVRRGFPVLVSAWAHVGAVLGLLMWVGSPVRAVERGGAGAADLGGEDVGAVVEASEDELDFGPALTKLVSIGVLVDGPAVAAASVTPPTVASPAKAPSKPVAAAPAPKPAAKAVSPATAVPPVATEAVAPADPALAEALPGAKRAEKGRKPSGKGKKEPCPVVEDDGVETLGEHAWSVERDVAEYYAGHLKELQKIASVRLVKDDEGKPDGFRVGVPRCSILREGGLRSGDVVKTVNGIHVHDLFTAIGAYFKLRREDTIVLNVVRKGEKLTLRYEMV